MRKVVDLRCAVCGRETSGTKTKRYCSDACRVRASRDRARGERARRAEVSERRARAIEELRHVRETVMSGPRLEEDSVELIRRERDLRTEELARAAFGDRAPQP
jgi:hypothetical protein